jgi:DNA-directed RNA polymerase specialized sigma24 family protein
MWLFGIARHQYQQAYRNRVRRQAIVVTFADEIRAPHAGPSAPRTR